MNPPYSGNEEMSDQVLIARVLSGEISYYEKIVRRYNSYLYKIGRSYGYNHSDTEDLMQDTYVEAYLHLKDFRKKASFKTWLAKIMLHLCYHKKQKFSYKKEVALQGDSIERTPLFTDGKESNTDKTVLNDELNDVLEEAIHQIPGDYRIVFTLRELNGLSVAETADTLNISEGNVKVRLNRAKQMLQKEIKSVYAKDDLFEFNLIYCDALANGVMGAITRKWAHLRPINFNYSGKL